MNEVLIYKRKPVKSRTWKIVFIIWFLIGFIPPFIDPSGEGFIIDFLAYALIWGTFSAGIWAFTLASINHYGTVSITEKRFKVGNQSVELTDINMSKLTETSTDTPGLADRLITSSGEVDAPLKFLRAEDTKTAPIFGGAWGTPVGSDSFIMEMKDGKRYTVPLPSGVREEVLETLSEAISKAQR